MMRWSGQNKQSGHWWLTVQHEAIGYWPDVLFTKLVDGSQGINWGGEILNGLSSGHHTATQMGSGHFPGEGFKRASFIRNIQYMDGDGVFRDPERLTPYASKPSCYDLEIKDWGPEFGTNFYYGGPGFSSICQLWSVERSLLEKKGWYINIIVQSSVLSVE